MVEEQPDLAQHEVKHRSRKGFAFILLTPDDTTGLVCVYVLPFVPFLCHVAAPDTLLSQVTDANAIVTFWVRQDRQGTQLASQVVAAVHDWLLTERRFDDHVFRVNLEEHATIRTLEHCGFQLRFELTMNKPLYHYLFFGKAAS